MSHCKKHESAYEVKENSFFLLFPACDVAGSHGDMKFEMANARIGEVKNLGSGRSSHSSLDNGRF